MIFARIYLYFYCGIIIYCSRDLGVHPLDETQCSFFMVSKYFITFLFSMKHSFLGNAAITLDVKISDFYMSYKILVILCMLYATICV